MRIIFGAVLSENLGPLPCLRPRYHPLPDFISVLVGVMTHTVPCLGGTANQNP